MVISFKEWEVPDSVLGTFSLLYRKDRSWRSGKLKTARREAGMTNRRLPV